MTNSHQVIRPSDGLFERPSARYIDVSPYAREQGFAWPVLLTEEAARELCLPGKGAHNSRVMQAVLLDALIHALQAKRSRKDWTEVTFEALIDSINPEQPGELRSFRLNVEQDSANTPRLILELDPRSAELAG